MRNFLFQVKTPYLTLAIKTKTLFVNRTPIKKYKWVLQAIAAQFILHFILNLTYPNSDKALYYAYLEIILWAEDS